jgi:hypothetical protein
MAIDTNINVNTVGNILIHYREGANIPISYTDEDGESIDLSGSQYYFEIEGILRKLLPTDPDDPTGKILRISRNEAALIPRLGASFIVIDETDPDDLHIVWEGKIIPRGWINAST